MSFGSTPSVGLGVVGTAGGVDVVVAAEEAVGGRVDPSLEADVERRLAPLGDGRAPGPSSRYSGPRPYVDA